MNVIDLVFLILLLWAAYKGFTKGFIIQLSTFAALLLGIIGAIKFSDITSAYIVKHFEISQQYLQILSFAVTFIIIVILVHFLARLINKLVDAIALGIVNRALGVLFSLLKTAFIISVLLVLLNKADNTYNFISDKTKDESLLYNPLSNFAPMIFPYLNFNKWKKEIEEINKKSKDETVNI
ncbi:MAG: CvpA family protein, partial [Bacteroidales bacterium]|jgi:membrane protein required for colicin V production|nr:CvpA family protein [Bacteroidales bacterium]